MAQDTFYKGTDWEKTVSPIVSRAFQKADLWPVGENSETGGTGDKQALTNGYHPFVAVGPVAQRPKNLVGVVITYDPDADVAQVNIAHGAAAKAYIANVLTYNAGAAATYETSLKLGQAVYIDDSDDLDAGVNLTLSPLNDAGASNPLAGYIWYDQDEYKNSGIGGPNSAALYPKTLANELTNFTATVLLANVA